MDSNYFELVWKIEKFSYILPFSAISSPYFHIDQSHKVSLCLILNCGSDPQKILGFQLRREGLDSLVPATVKCDISFVDQCLCHYRVAELRKECIKPSIECDFMLLVAAESLSVGLSKFLSDDVLTVSFRCWRMEESLKGIIQKVAHSRVGVHREVTNFSIPSFSDFEWPQSEECNVFEHNLHEDKSKDNFSTQIIPVHKSKNIKTLKINSSSDRLCITLSCIHGKVKYRISIYSVMGIPAHSVEDELYSTDVCSRKLTHLPRSLLENSKYTPNNILTLQVDISFSTNNISNEFETVIGDNFIYDKHLDATASLDVKPSSTSLVESICKMESLNSSSFTCTLESKNFKETMISDLRRLYEEGILSDFKLHVGENVIPVHKAVLCSRSEVFKSMLLNDAENVRDSMHIEDLDLETVQSIAIFLYTDTIQDMTFNKAVKFYCAADKYKILVLKNFCQFFLKVNLNVLNCYEILIHADKYCDKDLKETALNFMSRYFKQVHRSDSWENFVQQYVMLASELLYMASLRKYEKQFLEEKTFLASD